ncbi:MAG: ice-binding family protein [Acidobacteria bacterium]|nr:ice-binding family protein [Acidobacteriota bacterium]
MKRLCFSLVVSVASAALLVGSSSALAQVAPTLGTAGQFGVLANSAVTGSTGSGTVVSGDVGSYPTPTINNFPPSTAAAPYTVHRSADGVVQQAHTDAKTAYDFLAGQGGTTLNDNLSTNGIIGPGVYSLGAADLPASTTLTLNGSGIFIFNVASTLTMNTSSAVTGTANPCNVYWRVGTSATLNGTSFIGTVISDASITVGGGTVSGRVLAGTGATGAVSMPGSGGNTIGGCSTTPVPTLPQWAAAFLLAGLLGVGYLRLRRRSAGTQPTA